MSRDFIGVIIIAMFGFIIARTLKGEESDSILGGSVLIVFVLGTILDDASRGLSLAVGFLVLGSVIQKVTNFFKKKYRGWQESSRNF